MSKLKAAERAMYMVYQRFSQAAAKDLPAAAQLWRFARDGRQFDAVRHSHSFGLLRSLGLIDHNGVIPQDVAAVVPDSMVIEKSGTVRLVDFPFTQPVRATGQLGRRGYSTRATDKKALSSDDVFAAVERLWQGGAMEQVALDALWTCVYDREFQRVQDRTLLTLLQKEGLVNGEGKVANEAVYAALRRVFWGKKGDHGKSFLCLKTGGVFESFEVLQLFQEIQIIFEHSPENRKMLSRLYHSYSTGADVSQEEAAWLADFPTLCAEGDRKALVSQVLVSAGCVDSKGVFSLKDSPLLNDFVFEPVRERRVRSGPSDRNSDASFSCSLEMDSDRVIFGRLHAMAVDASGVGSRTLIHLYNKGRDSFYRWYGCGIDDLLYKYNLVDEHGGELKSNVLAVVEANMVKDADGSRRLSPVFRAPRGAEAEVASAGEVSYPDSTVPGRLSEAVAQFFSGNGRAK